MFISRVGALARRKLGRDGGVGGDALHFNQKSSMSLSYLALETGQPRAAVSCFNTLLAVAASQSSRPLLRSSRRLSRLQREAARASPGSKCLRREGKRCFFRSGRRGRGGSRSSPDPFSVAPPGSGDVNKSLLGLRLGERQIESVSPLFSPQ